MAVAINVLLTIGMITRRALMVLENNLTFTKYVNRQYDSAYAVSGAKIGTTLNIRVPVQYLVNTTDVLFGPPGGGGGAAQASVETQVPLVLSFQHHVDINFTSQDLTLSIDDFSDRFIVPSIAALANEIDRRGLLLYQQVANIVGNTSSGLGVPPGSTTAGAVDTAGNTLLAYGNAYAQMDNEATPRDNLRSTIINPNANNYTVAALSGLFHSSTEIEEQYRSGNMGLSGGSKYSMDQNVVVHTFGPLGGSPIVATTPANGATTIASSGWTASGLRLRAGDVITFAGATAVNPQSRQSLGYLRRFVVTADGTADGGGLITIPIRPAIHGPNSPLQNVTALPVGGSAAIAFPGGNGLPASGIAAGTVAAQNMAFHRDAFTVASADLEMPGGVDMAAVVSSPKLGFSMRMVRQYDINNDAFPCRVDILYGWAAIRPQMACRILG